MHLLHDRAITAEVLFGLWSWAVISCPLDPQGRREWGIDTPFLKSFGRLVHGYGFSNTNLDRHLGSPNCKKLRCLVLGCIEANCWSIGRAPNRSRFFPLWRTSTFSAAFFRSTLFAPLYTKKFNNNSSNFLLSTVIFAEIITYFFGTLN